MNALRRRRQFGGRASTLLLALLSVSCAMIDRHERVEGWPQLTIVENHVPGKEMRDRCAKYAPWGSIPLACAEFNFAAKRCDIWFSNDYPPSRALVEHERLHCRGYDHVGENAMAQMLQRYLAATGGAAPAGSAAAGGSAPQ